MGPIPEAEAAREFASAKCAYALDKASDVPDTCEAEVEQQFAAAQQRAADQGRSYDPECLQERVDTLRRTPYFYDSTGCPVYPGTAVSPRLRSR